MSSSDFRERARQMLRGKWGIAILTTFVAGLLGGLVTGSGNVSLDLDQDTVEIIYRLPKIVRTYLAVAASIGATFGFVTFIIGGTVKLGYCKFLLNLHDNKPADIKDLFSQFDRFGDGFLLSLLTALYTFLWSLLFVIPGIIAGYKYAMAPFIMAENPGMKPNEAITASKELMDGNKLDLFCLDWSFIGWVLLNMLTLGIGGLWLRPYTNAARAAFYRNLCPVPVIYYPQEEESQNPWEQMNT